MSTRHSTHTPAVVPAPAESGIHERYADIADHRLAVALSTEDAAEETGLDPLERTTCHTHRRWLHHCVSSPLHVIVVTGHRWCRRCSCAVQVAVDELTGDVRLTCPRCHEMPPGAANRQVVRSCRASLAAARHTEPWTVRAAA
ncbi:hypothetical protein [Actinophytocola sp.]|uniref:hypothetical protein n=1 Tax=Actinophytocola sp. TaxID=1872138 RepID=UPI003D6AF6E4